MFVRIVLGFGEGGGLFSDLRIFRVFGFLDVGILRFGSSRSIGLRVLWIVAFGVDKGSPRFREVRAEYKGPT